MSYRRPVRLLGLVLPAGAILAAALPARADPDAGAAPRASLTCDRADGPGRVRCEAEARVGPGESISWGDVVVLHAPSFAMTLRGRIGPHDATLQEPEVWRWAFALVARDKGTGDVEARVRIVVCQGKTCAPREIPIVGKLVVGG
jgi:hypothetical protein